MTRNFDNFLLGLLWLLSVSLAITFWMNINYGFNVLSSAHWAYLSELQASRTQIKFDFYISLIAAIVIGLAGLYIIMRPRIKSEQKTAISATTTFEPQSHNIQQKQTPLVDNTEQPRQFKPVQQPPKISIQNRPLSPSNAISPAPQPRQTFTPPIPKATQPIPNANSTKSTPQTQNPEIRNILESFGYIIKPCRKIGNITMPTVALGYDNTLWIVASNVKFDDMQDAIQTLIALFDDTLGDAASDIIIHGCIIGGTEKSGNPDLISIFTNIDTFKQFISKQPNTKPDDFDSDLFDAISTYISTVMNYIGKE